MCAAIASASRAARRPCGDPRRARGSAARPKWPVGKRFAPSLRLAGAAKTAITLSKKE